VDSCEFGPREGICEQADDRGGESQIAIWAGIVAACETIAAQLAGWNDPAQLTPRRSGGVGVTNHDLNRDGNVTALARLRVATRC
jgi:hypothetical protein